MRIRCLPGRRRLGGRTVIVAGLLALSLPASGAWTGSASAQSGPVPRYERLAPTGTIRPANLAASGNHPRLVRPFLPHDPRAYASAKGAAGGRAAGRRGGAKTPGLANRQGAAPSPVAPRQLGGFPVMSLAAQVGLYPTDQAVAPPDTQLAAGPTQLVEMNNSTMSVWSKSGTRLATSDLNAFFPVPTGWSFTDPRVLYDAGSGRWFASGMSLDASHDRRVYVALSLTADATAGWTIYTVADYAGTDADQPKLGVSDDKVVLS